jgi:4-carboxymuconolactone decarboxylase
MARLPLVDPDATDPRLQAVFSLFANGDREVPELYRVLGNAPALLEAWTNFAWPLRHEASIPRGLRELAIVRVAQLTGASYEWRAHAPAALKFGVAQEILDGLDQWPTLDGLSDMQREILAFTDQLTVDLVVGDDTFAALADRWSPAELVELTLTVAFYSCVSRVLTALDITAE